MVSVPTTIEQAVEPYAECPDAIWQGIVYLESGFNPSATGDVGSSFGLFQLHLGGQANAALSWIENTYGLQQAGAITYLLQHPSIQAQFGMPPINAAWKQYGATYSPFSSAWWTNFCIASGHPGGSPNDPATVNYVNRMLNEVVKPNLFNIQQASGTNAGGNPVTTPSPQETVDSVFTRLGLWKWYSSTPTQYFDGVSEKGEDFAQSFGTPVGSVSDGIVMRIAHNNNSIGDVVEIQASNGAVFLYQHITTRCWQGQHIGVGTVVGTQNGLPVDQYSTGSHIEVRYCAPGTWNSSVDSWNEPWINPLSVFASIGSNPVSGGAGTTTDTPLATLRQWASYAQNAQEAINHLPGFQGIAVALDDIEKFQPFVIHDTANNQDIQIGTPFGTLNTGITNPVALPSDTIQAVLVFVTANTVAFLIRAVFVLAGLMLLWALILNITSSIKELGGEMTPLSSDNASQLAELAMMVA